MQKWLKKIISYLKIFIYFLGNKKIQATDYRQDYDTVAPTYDRWLEAMGKYTDELMTVFDSDLSQSMNILDFCSGTGYITTKILNRFPEQYNWRITGVDISEQMIKLCKMKISDPRADFLRQDGARFLEQAAPAAYDLLFCGWALVYFKIPVVIKQFARCLKPGGLACVILNQQQTLRGIEESFLEIMAEHPAAFQKIMDIRFSLPNGKQELKKWFAAAGFVPLKTGEGEEIMSFDTPALCLQWLRETGALAGTWNIFPDPVFLEKQMLAKIKTHLAKNGQYSVNHKFVYGIFKKEK